MIFSKFISLDIGNYYIKIIEASQVGKKIKVNRCGLLPTPSKTMEDGRILDVESLAKPIIKYLKENHIKERNAVITISGTSLITRELVLPKAGRKELKSIIELEAPQAFPINLNDYVLDYKVLEEIQVENVNQYRVLLVAVPLSVVEKYMELVERCGLYIYAIDYKGNSIVKFINHEIKQLNHQKKFQKKDKNSKDFQPDVVQFLLERNINIEKSSKQNTEEQDESEDRKEEQTLLEPKNSTMAIIDMGYKTTTVTIIKNGILQFSRILLYGSEKFSQTIADKLEIPLDEAEEKVKFSINAYTSTGDVELGEEAAVLDTLRIELINFTDDITRFFDYYYSRNNNNAINHIYLIGGGALIKGINEYIENAFHIKTGRFTEFNSVQWSKKCSQFQDKQIYFCNCLGAILNR